MMLAEARTLVSLALLLSVPGLSWMIWTGLGRGWPWPSRLALATALSVAFYPILFYLTPVIAWGPLSLGGLLLFMVVAAVVVRLRGAGAPPPNLPQLGGGTGSETSPAWGGTGRVTSSGSGRTGGVAPTPTWGGPGWGDWVDVATAVVLLLIVGVRVWVAHAHPFPAWTDSLHHTLLTQLTATSGRLPVSLEPYFPVPLDMYHRGLYALSAPVMWLAQVPAHTALLWTSQALNALGALAVYMVLERRVGRVAGLVGALTVGLLSFQPAFYVNWGRFTQLSAQAILPVAWWVTYWAVQRWREKGLTRSSWLWVATAAWLNAGVFVLHYRVAVFYLPLLALTALELVGWRPTGQAIRRTAVGLVVVGGLTLLLLSPVVGTAVSSYVAEQAATTTAVARDPARADAVRTAYFYFPWESFWFLALRPWLLALTLAGALVGILRRNRLVWISLIWALLLFGVGNAYLLRVPLLNVTNLGAVLILYYLPAGFILGAAAAEVVGMLPVQARRWAERGVAVVCVAAALVTAPLRGGEIEPFRHFVTPADERALAWVREHTPADARFAVNTVFWLPEMPHGTDAGYWLPYLAERRMSAGVMLLNLSARDEIEAVVADSQAVVTVALDPTAVDLLRARGITHLYSGARGNYAGNTFDVDELAQQPGVEVLYRDGPVVVLRLVGP